ncbi:MAG: ATP-dependent Clp protease ATP-binding subunit [Candidatus Yanofskybacteria bacterium]|nr:ATP-dependent Clp protease ATP-binding subunit [Candidatus Yanofskybacteria bacterium]
MAEYFSGSQDSLIKISCAGFSQAHMVHKILGAPPSYIGFDRKPLLSQEHIDSIAIPKTALVSTRSVEPDGSDCSEKILDSINLLQAQIMDFEDRIGTNMSLINFLGSYNKLLNTGGAEIGEKPLREIFRDKGMETEMMSLLGKESSRILSEDICTPLYNTVLILDLYAQTKGLIELRERASMGLEEAYHYLRDINTPNVAEADRVSVSAPEPSKKRLDRVVILFDEIEKGNEALHNLLLEIMEDGKVTLANNEVTDLSNAFIVLTGNIGAKLIGDAVKGKKTIGFGMPGNTNNLEVLDKQILSITERALDKVFSPEFKGRLENIIIFRPLSPESFRQILDDRIEIFQTALKSHNIELEIDNAVRDAVVKQSLHRPEVGARLLDHKFKSVIKVPLSRELAKRKNFQGSVKASIRNSRVEFEFDKAHL